MAVLRTHEDRGHPVGLIASLSVPWGNHKSDHDLGGYHLVWTRDLVESAVARYLTETADARNDSIEQWTYVTDTAMARSGGVDGYYVRIAPRSVGDAEVSAHTLALQPQSALDAGREDAARGEPRSMPGALELRRVGDGARRPRN